MRFWLRALLAAAGVASLAYAFTWAPVVASGDALPAPAAAALILLFVAGVSLLAASLLAKPRYLESP